MNLTGFEVGDIVVADSGTIMVVVEVPDTMISNNFNTITHVFDKVDNHSFMRVIYFGGRVFNNAPYNDTTKKLHKLETYFYVDENKSIVRSEKAKLNKKFLSRLIFGNVFTKRELAEERVKNVENYTYLLNNKKKI